MPSFSKVTDVYDRALSWQYRVMRASVGTTTGAVTMAILGLMPPGSIPVFGKTCTITLQGLVVADLYTGGMCTRNFPIGPVDAVRNSVRRLADHCKLSDDERIAFFDEFRKWIKVDERALSGLTSDRK